MAVAVAVVVVVLSRDGSWKRRRRTGYDAGQSCAHTPDGERQSGECECERLYRVRGAGAGEWLCRVLDRAPMAEAACLSCALEHGRGGLRRLLGGCSAKERIRQQASSEGTGTH